MSLFEAGGPCGYHEYINGENRRLMGEELNIDELYLLMIALRAPENKPQAAKIPSRVLQTERTQNGAHVVRFAVLNDDLQATTDMLGVVSNGYWTDAKGRVYLAPGKVPVTSGYFKGYEDSMNDELRQISDSVLVS